MPEEVMTIALVSIVTGGIVIISVFAALGKAIGNRGANRKQLEKIHQDIAEMKQSIEEIKEQIADVIIKFG
ncbi:hypothetical protein GF312_11000 [Candidatus Poribacteria bacterium]|nr:hypothetical protein [Candidatus Poribacteria bacterium]